MNINISVCSVVCARATVNVCLCVCFVPDVTLILKI